MGQITRSPTVRLLLGLLITLGAVTGFSSYALYQLHGLRKLQTDIVDLNRHDSLQLLQVQNDLNSIGLMLRDMTEGPDGSGISRYRTRFNSLRTDLSLAIRQEAQLSPVRRRPERQLALTNAFKRFWTSSDEIFATADAGHEALARELAYTQLFSQQADLSTRVSALLERNNVAEEMADKKISDIYDGVERDIYGFLAATMLAIAGTSLYLIYSNRKIFGQLESLSRQRRVLAGRLFTVQEEVLRSVSRELHDEFGQILTAVGAMLLRAERKGIPPDSPFRSELSEVREITHNTLEKIRSLSQMLHPAVIDDYGLAKAIEWYTSVFNKQTGIQTSLEITGEPIRITGQPAIHCFRVLQEALNNAAKHSGSNRARVSMEFSANRLKVAVSDFGRGITQKRKNEWSGLGLIAMRERAELLNGTLDVSSSVSYGTTVTVAMPLKQEDVLRDEMEYREQEEVFDAKL